MRLFKSVLFGGVVACVLQAGMVYAAPVHGPTARVVKTRADSSNIGIVYLSENICDNISVPCGCLSDSHRNMIAVDLETAGGKAMMSIALAAQVSGKKLEVVFYNECKVIDTVAEAAYVSLVD